jgi:glycerophosphoryl diester phosphodiesterase
MLLRNSNMLSASLFLIGVLCSYLVKAQKVDILPAHAHNDYEHGRPLFEALEGRFRSVEADIFSRGDSLYVAHDAHEIRPGRTLRALYLEPLKKIVRENNLSVYGDGTPLMLLVDIKDDGLETYKRLHDILTGYRHMLTRFADGTIHHGAVTVIVSGNRPLEYMKTQDMRYAGYDGRVGDLNKDFPASLMPLVSDNWTNHFSWSGNGTMPIDQWAKLQGIVGKAHRNGYMLRFWATPDRPGDARESVWKVLKEAGVDLIGTDDLKGLENWLRSNPDR